MSLIGKKKLHYCFFGFKKTVDTDEQVKLHSWKKLCNVCIRRKYWYWVIRIESATKEGLVNKIKTVFYFQLSSY